MKCGLYCRAAIRNPWASNAFNAAISHKNNQSSFGNNLSLSQNQTDFDKKTWPSLEEINSAELDYMEVVKRCKIKDKFVKFHRENFDRMRQCLVLKDFTLKVFTPRTIHLK